MRLGKELEEVFPIVYDLKGFCTAASEVLVGRIEAQPSIRLSRSEIVQLAVPK